MQKVKITPRDPQYTNKSGVKNNSTIRSSSGGTRSNSIEVRLARKTAFEFSHYPLGIVCSTDCTTNGNPLRA